MGSDGLHLRLGVNVLVLYLEATLDAFSNWFRDYSRQMSHAHPLPPGLKFLFLSAAKVEFNQAIGECRLVMPGIFQFHQHAPETHPEALMLTVQPVGRGQTNRRLERGRAEGCVATPPVSDLPAKSAAFDLCERAGPGHRNAEGPLRQGCSS